MNFKIMFLILPLFAILTGFVTYTLILIGRDLIFGLIFCSFMVIVGSELLIAGLHSPQSHFKKISKESIVIEQVEVVFEDGTKSIGNFYRSASQTLETPNGRRYPEPRPVIIYFHGFWNKKEISEKYLIPLASIGYIGFAFDQRGHGDAGGKKDDWARMFMDVTTILDEVCAVSDVRMGSVCCCGTSMGGTSVLTKGYEDARVAMVVGMSALHDVDPLLKRKVRVFSLAWFVKRQIAKWRKTEVLNIAAHYFLKEDSEFNKNRVFLVHAKEDTIFPPEITFELNKKQAQIPDDQTLLLEGCEHGLEGQETLILAVLLQWIQTNTAMKLK